MTTILKGFKKILINMENLSEKIVLFMVAIFALCAGTFVFCLGCEFLNK